MSVNENECETLTEFLEKVDQKRIEVRYKKWLANKDSIEWYNLFKDKMTKEEQQKWLIENL